MAVIAQKGTVAALMQKTLNRQEEQARMKFKVKPKQVKKILMSYMTNQSGPLEDLLAVLKKYPFEGDNFRYLTEDCIECVVLLDSNMKKFVNAVLNIQWVNTSPQNVQLFSKFVVDLVTAHAYHAPLVMKSLVKCFKEGDENWTDSPPEELVMRWSYIHSLIAQIVAVMPMTSTILMQSILDQFPYFKSGVYTNRAYIHNLLWITKYIPSLLEQVVTAIINRLVIMDVNIVDRSKSKQQEVFSMDVEEEDAGLNEALDYCILEVLNWLQEERTPALQTMCGVFEKIILPTYGIRHVQFLVLFTISTSQQCADRILQNLYIIAAGLQGLGPAGLTTRRIAASHLAGLLARCVRVPNSRLISYLRQMSDWCHSYITAAQESTTATDSVKVHGAFYGMCHAVFYLIAFKHQHLFMNKDSINFVESLNLPRLVTCHLNPLKNCPPQVAAAFSSVTRSHQLVYCQAIIERNSRHTLNSTTQEIDEWFPYDPYKLPVSGKIIWPLCTEYKDWLQDGDDESQLTTRMKQMEEDDDFLMGSVTSGRVASSLSHCISPGFKST